MTAAGYLCYLRSIHHIIDQSHRLPWRDQLLKMSPQLLSVVVLLVFLTVVLLKAYAIGIVWRCYKYLTMRQHNIRSMLPYIIPEISARQVTFITLDYTLLRNAKFIHLFFYFLCGTNSSFRNETITLCCPIMKRQ